VSLGDLARRKLKRSTDHTSNGDCSQLTRKCHLEKTKMPLLVSMRAAGSCLRKQTRCLVESWKDIL
jgi:hypothetical protein